MQELEAKCLASNNAEIANLENRLARLERKSSTSTDDLNEVFAGGLTSIADRLEGLAGQSGELSAHYRRSSWALGLGGGALRTMTVGSKTK